MFRFNFVGGNEGDSGEEVSPPTSIVETRPTESLRPCTELVPVSDRSEMAFVDFRISETCCIRKAANPVVDASAAVSTASAQTATGVSVGESDLIPGQYEGGYKVWECSIDLSRYIARHSEVATMFKSDKRVIELGSGQGLVGIVAMALGAGEVHFQDYDIGVIRDLTIPVVEENVRCLDGTFKPKVRFFAGDWGTLQADILQPQNLGRAYDVILTTETIYNEQTSIRLLSCIKACLKPTGVCYLSAKSFYFGVGGGVAGFQQLLDRDGTFQHRVLQVIDDGRSNRREILELRVT